MILFILLTLLCQTFSLKFEFTEYTRKSEAFDGTPCITGCSPENDCVVNWDWGKKNCRTFEVAPIYLTSRKRDPLRKYCLTNCGYFGETYEWCVTTEDLKWDFCSSYQSKTFLASKEPVAQTRMGKMCIDKCRPNLDGEERYYWCHFMNEKNEETWEYCAPPALPRIPVLPENFHIGNKLKGNCNGFLRYVSTFIHCVSATEAPDNLVINLADAIEGSTISNSLTKVSIPTNFNTPVEKYTMVNIRDIMVPAVVRAHITNDSIQAGDPVIPVNVKRKLRLQMTGSSNSYEEGQLIGHMLGGPSEEYNVVPRSVNWKCEEWSTMEQAVKNWCRTTGGSVDMVVVVFYKDTNTPIPHAFGVSLTFRDSDNSLFVDCRDKIHWNTLKK